MKKTILIAVAVLALAGLGGGIWYFLKSKPPTGGNQDQNSAAVAAGKELANNKCSGTGPGMLTALPMNFGDFSMILPYGGMIDNHVTPIDHQYYSPTVFNSPRDTYPVYAMADARLVDIQPRDTDRGREYRMVFSMTCTFLYYYDLVTSLAPDIKTVYDKNKNSQGYVQDLDIQVKSGQEIGRIGGQTLDFAVWDTTKPLTGFVNPESYRSESWKIYTADPLDYAAADIREKMLAKYIRTAEPRSGKIDYDIDGRLIGNWFLEGTNGYAGSAEETAMGSYARGHLSIAPDQIDPTAFIASFGDYQGRPRQISLSRTSPNPSDVAVETELVKYNLFNWQWREDNGRDWDRFSFPSVLPLTLYNEGFRSEGCVLFQLVEDRKLKMETFPGKNCSGIGSFTSGAKFYER